MKSKEPIKKTKSFLKNPLVIIISVLILFYIGYLFGQFLFEIIN
jgi:fumarate reductase subunit C